MGISFIRFINMDGIITRIFATVDIFMNSAAIIIKLTNGNSLFCLIIQIENSIVTNIRSQV